MTRFAQVLLDALYDSVNSDNNELLFTLVKQETDGEMLEFAVNHLDIKVEDIDTNELIGTAIANSNPAFALWIIKWANIKWPDIADECASDLGSLTELKQDDADAIITALKIPVGDCRLMPLIYNTASKYGIDHAQALVDRFRLATSTVIYDHIKAIRMLCRYRRVRIDVVQWCIDTFEVIDDAVAEIDDRLHPWECPLVKRAY